MTLLFLSKLYSKEDIADDEDFLGSIIWSFPEKSLYKIMNLL